MMHKTRFKDWVCNEIEHKINERQMTATSGQNGRKAVLKGKDDPKNDSDSSDRYDPLADSDASSNRSDSPVKLEGADLQRTIKEEMRLKNVSNLHQREFWKGLVSSSDPDPPLDENGEPVEIPEKTLSSFAIIKKMMRLKEKQDQMPEE